MEKKNWIKPFLLIFAILLVGIDSSELLAQNDMLEKKVTIQYFEVRLEDALDDISKDYDVNFSYSVDRISVHQKVSADVENAPLSLALEDLLAETDIIYAGIGDQVVLKVDREKQRLLSQNVEEEIFEIKPKPVPVVRREYVAQPMKIGLHNENITTHLQEPEYPMDIVPVFDPYYRNKMSVGMEVEVEEIFETADDGEKVMQITLMGRVGTNLNKNAETTNKLSVNVFMGKNGGVNGVEVGGIVNSVVNDVNGVQVAGIGNTVGGDVDGTQAAGIFNVNRGNIMGIQAAGIVNVGQMIQGVQAAGIFNLANQGVQGMQVAGIGNVAGKDSENGMQVAGIFNINRGKSNLQIASILNIGKNVKGCQIGLINISDSVNTSIGLINIVKHGYNRFEISGAEALQANVELKLGSNRFYNIFHFGFRPTGANKTWGIGYGIGTRFGRAGKKLTHNLEVLVDKLQTKNERFDENLNLLTQLRWTWDYRIGKKKSLFLGPTLNLKIMNFSSTEEMVLEDDIAPKTFFHRTTQTSAIFPGATTVNYTYQDVKMWVGFKAGIRF